MGKRKHYKDEYEEISRKMKKLERKLIRARRRENRSPAQATSNYNENSSEQQVEGEDNLNNFYDEMTGSSAIQIAADQPTPSVEDTRSIPEQPLMEDMQEAINLETEGALDSEILEILGEDPLAKSVYGKVIHKELANRLQYILTNGLTKDERNDLVTKYLIPANCPVIQAPELNLEIKAAIPEMSLKRDKAMETRQKQLASAIACVSEITSIQLQLVTKDNLLLKYLMDANKILCDLQHGDSVKRRFFTSSSLKKEITDQLIPTKIDKYLFGENLAGTLTAAKAVSRSGAEIKNNFIKKPTQQQPPRNLNWRARGTARRQPTLQSNRQPASARARPETSSRPSRRPPPPPPPPKYYQRRR